MSLLVSEQEVLGGLETCAANEEGPGGWDLSVRVTFISICLYKTVFGFDFPIFFSLLISFPTKHKVVVSVAV